MKQRGVGITVAAIGLLALLFGAPRAALACTCTGPVGQRALSGAAAMFAGTVTGVQLLEPDGEKIEPAILVTFRVAKVWKGPVDGTLKLRTVLNKWTCNGSSFTEGVVYLVTAYKVGPAAKGGPPELSEINTCGGTLPIALASDIVAGLGPGKTPKPDQADSR
jgi:hypothetical protein